MSWPNSPEWLRELQSRFSDLLRTPLERSTGSLRAPSATYDDRLVSAVLPSPTVGNAERLAVYHRQYWFRLFTALRALYPLSARLVGDWHFNDLAARHLLKRPPHGFDLDVIGDDFEHSITEHLGETRANGDLARWSVDPTAVLEAARVDAAFHRVMRASHSEPLRLAAADASRLSDSCLRLSPSAALVQERWPLAELRAGLVESQEGTQIQLAERWPSPRHWLVLRQGSKLGLLALEPREAELLGLLQQLPLARALGRLEAAAPPAERALLPERTQAWLGRSVRLGIWVGFVEAPI